MFSHLIFQDLKQVALIHTGLATQYHTSNCQTGDKVIGQGAYRSKSNQQDRLENMDGMERNNKIQQGANAGVRECAWNMGPRL